MERLNRIVSHVTANTQAVNAAPCAGITGHIKPAPPDAILGINQAFKASKDPRKVNVCVGAYRDDAGKPVVLKCVQEAEKRIAADISKNIEYLPQRGDPDFCALSRKVLMGDCAAIKENRVATVQTLSGTGSLRIGGAFIKEFLQGKTVYCSVPTWGTHNSILQHSGLKIGTYKYWNDKTRGLDFDGMVADVKNAPDGSVFLLHACAHNPTGVDPTKQQWKALSDVMKAKNHIAWFDSAYQGFASGSLDEDAYAVQLFLAEGHDIMASVSYAKNFGLYGERIGSFSVVCADKENTEAVMTQLDVIIRNLYSNPPLHGMRIVKTILSDAALTKLWHEEMVVMSQRIISMRKMLRAALEKNGAPGTWSHITSQIGMFSYTGLSKSQSEAMLSKHQVYMLVNGRISMAGVTTGNVQYIADAMKAVLTEK